MESPDVVKSLQAAADIASEYSILKYNPTGIFGLEIAHLHSEVSEVYRATVKDEGRVREIDELSDVLLNTLVAARQRGVSIDELFLGARAKAGVLQGRINDIRQSHESQEPAKAYEL